MGILLIFMSEEIAQLEAFKKTLKDEKQIEELDKIIESLRKKSNVK